MAQVGASAWGGLQASNGRLEYAKAGLITYKYGTQTILEPDGLVEGACECYGLMEREFEKIFDHSWLDIAGLSERVAR